MTLVFAYGGTGEPEKGLLGVDLPVLAGAPTEVLLEGAEKAPDQGVFLTWRSPGATAGYACARPGEDLDRFTERVYGDLLRAARGSHLYRIWNFIPRINEPGPAGLENYRAFCRGRSLAFEAALGTSFAGNLPAASAVGGEGPLAAVAFLAGDKAGSHFENPAQVPAYEYPTEHGPRPPSFARATTVVRGGLRDAFVSGTSAIVGHATVAPHDTSTQLSSTFDNLSRISRACGLGDDLGRALGGVRHFKVYLRHPAELAEAADRLSGRFLVPGDRVTYLRADICRAALNVEIEVSIRGASSN